MKKVFKLLSWDGTWWILSKDCQYACKLSDLIKLSDRNL